MRYVRAMSSSAARRRPSFPFPKQTAVPRTRFQTSRSQRLTMGAAAGASILLVSAFAGSPAWAAQPPVGLGTVAPFAVLGGQTVTNTGTSTIFGDVGVSPGTAITGFPPGVLVPPGTIHATDTVAAQAQSDLTTAYLDAAGRTPFTVESADLGGQTLAPGVYEEAALTLTGTLTLNGQGDPNSVFIFQAGSTLTTASNSTVSLIDGAQPCNVFWQVGSSATLGTTTTFVGTIMALTSASLDTGATVMGRVLAQNGAVTLDDNVITESTCAATSPVTTTTAPSATSGGTGTGGSASGVSSATGSGTSGSGSGSGVASSSVVPLGSPQTGFGGASRTTVGVGALLLGGLASLGAVGAIGQAVRRRRLPAHNAGPGHRKSSGDG